jgi:hypothetical protein
MSKVVEVLRQDRDCGKVDPTWPTLNSCTKLCVCPLFEVEPRTFYFSSPGALRLLFYIDYEVLVHMAYQRNGAGALALNGNNRMNRRHKRFKARSSSSSIPNYKMRKRQTLLTFGNGDGEVRFPDYGPHIVIVDDTSVLSEAVSTVDWYPPEGTSVVNYPSPNGVVDDSDRPPVGEESRLATPRPVASQATPPNNTPHYAAPTTAHPRPQAATAQNPALVVPNTPPSSHPSTRIVLVTASTSQSQRARASLAQNPSTTAKDIISTSLVSSTTSESASPTSTADPEHNKASIIVSFLLVSLLGVAAVSAFASWLLRVRRRRQLRQFERMSIMNRLQEQGAASNPSIDAIEKDVEAGTVDAPYVSSPRPPLPFYPEYPPGLCSPSAMHNSSPRMQGRMPAMDRSPLHIANLAPGDIYRGGYGRHTTTDPSPQPQLFVPYDHQDSVVEIQAPSMPWQADAVHPDSQSVSLFLSIEDLSSLDLLELSFSESNTSSDVTCSGPQSTSQCRSFDRADQRSTTHLG